MTSTEIRHDVDVVVVGAGNAALCAALAAREQGASVLVLEKAPPSEQGGNCPYTGGGFRFVHEGTEDLRRLLDEAEGTASGAGTMGPYTADDYRTHLLTVTEGETNTGLMEVLIARSRPTVDWMHASGVRWEIPAGRGGSRGAPTTVPSGVGLTAWRSGPGLIQMLTAAARRAGVEILYETPMTALVQGPSGAVSGVGVRDADGSHEIGSRAVVLACGGFEANARMRAEHLGPGWERARVRGSRHNSGDGHRAAIAVGAATTGQWEGCHGTPIDVDAPDTGVLEVTDRMPRRSYPLGITVNLDGRRFVDEGEGYAEQTFVGMGRAILSQKDGLAYQVFDGRAAPHLEARYGSARHTRAGSPRELAAELGIDAVALEETIEAFNAGAHEGEYTPRQADGRSTAGLSPPKSNWAIKLDTPPFVAYAVTGGITYTYGGLRIDVAARVLDEQGEPIGGLYAAGEIVGGIFYHNSLRAAGLMHGAVFGRLAGMGAADSRPGG